MATVQYWAAARDAAGTSTEEIAGHSVRTVLELACASHGPVLTKLVATSLVLIDGETLDPADDAAASAATVIEILPPFAGG